MFSTFLKVILLHVLQVKYFQFHVNHADQMSDGM